MNKFRLFLAFSFLTLSLSSFSLSADQSGAMLANSCAGCHGTKGKSSSNIPGISQLSPPEIAMEMKVFKSGERKSTIMGRIAKGFSEKQIKIMSEYLGAKK